MASIKRLLPALSVVARVVLIVVILGIGWGLSELLASAKEDPQATSAEVAPVPVRAILATAVRLPRTVTGYGTARAMDAAVISSQVAARVMERPSVIEPGMRVDAGAVLLRLDKSDFENRVEAGRERLAAFDAQLESVDAEAARLAVQLELAEQEVAVAQRDLERIEEARSGGSGTDADVDQRLGSLRRAERTLETIRQAAELLPPRRAQIEAERRTQMATLRLDEADLTRSEISAPIAGVLQEVMAEPGEYLRVGDEIARLVSLRRVEVPLRLPASAWPSLAELPEVRARLVEDGGAGRSWTGPITRVAPEADERTRTVTVFVEIEQDPESDPGTLLKPGMFVRGEVVLDDGVERIAVPRRAVVGDRVLVAEPNTAEAGGSVYRVRSVPVQVNYSAEGELPRVEPVERQWVLLEPDSLEPGALVVISNLDSLIGGARVEPSLPGEASGRASINAGGGAG
ncbi:MAG: HlyD family efflux transporter periplasmic adaptor subunit [Planctomycetota bacterium]